MSIIFKIPVTQAELRLDLTLQSGQCFRWFNIESKKWRGVLNNHIWTLHQDDNYLYCDVYGCKTNQLGSKDNLNLQRQIRNYFRMENSLSDLYNAWASRDPIFERACKDFPGIRMLDQDPMENVFSFICSSNNNIQRITSLVGHLCEHFGTCVGALDGRKWYSFPSVQNLCADGTEAKLRELAFGYRAKYIQMSAQMIEQNGGSEWLFSLRKLPYDECRAEILKLPGVGPKVADCICLMSMNHLEAIPVDTHVFQIALRNYLPHLKGKKSLTPKVYNEISLHFRQLFGLKAGWAHSVLFTADLKKFKELNTECDKKSVKRRRNEET